MLQFVQFHPKFVLKRVPNTTFAICKISSMSQAEGILTRSDINDDQLEWRVPLIKRVILVCCALCPPFPARLERKMDGLLASA